MPYIDIKLTDPLPSKEAQDKIAKEITEIFVKNLNKIPDRVVINFEEVKAKDFYFAGKSVEDLRKEN
ncbi:MAG: 4-oxalocrotonate tautomerase family protein [Campylobacteraceae bacterium]|nr:4-oxalocrotonate tautomerase family protein [Campylobacteraceae bacterium]